VQLRLLDLMAEIVKTSEVNRMNAKNMAIVMSPNLFSIETENPMVAMEKSQQVADFTLVILKARLSSFHGVDLS